MESISGLMATQLSRLNIENKPIMNSNDKIDIQFKLPKLSIIQKLSPNELISIRNEYNAEYLVAFSDWAETGQDGNLRCCIKNYCKSLTKEVLKKYTSELDRFEISISKAENIVPAAAFAANALAARALVDDKLIEQTETQVYVFISIMTIGIMSLKMIKKKTYKGSFELVK